MPPWASSFSLYMQAMTAQAVAQLAGGIDSTFSMQVSVSCADDRTQSTVVLGATALTGDSVIGRQPSPGLLPGLLAAGPSATTSRLTDKTAQGALSSSMTSSGCLIWHSHQRSRVVGGSCYAQHGWCP